MRKFSIAILTAVLMAALSTMAQAQCVKTVDMSGVQTVDLIAGQNIIAGSVSVSVNGNDLEITYNTIDGWELVETHLWVGESRTEMPQTRKGNPKIGNFPYQSGDITGATTYSFSIPYTVLNFSCPGVDEAFFVAAHGVVHDPGPGAGLTGVRPNL